MTAPSIQQALAQVAAYLRAHPEDARTQDRPAVAVLEAGLRCRATGPKGAELVTDMPVPVGGGGSAPTPGWFLRAALANCDATVIAMRAAELGITLTQLEVTVGSESDDRGVLGVEEGVPAGPLQVNVQVRIAAQDASPAQLEALVRWAEQHSPVSDALRRAVPTRTEIIIA